MPLAVPREERDPPTVELPDDEVVARIPERRGDTDPLGVAEELIEARAADDADLGAGGA